MLLFCGYNGFQQLGALCPTASNLTAEYISEFCCTNISSNKIILDASWSEVLVIQSKFCLFVFVITCILVRCDSEYPYLLLSHTCIW